MHIWNSIVLALGVSVNVLVLNNGFEPLFALSCHTEHASSSGVRPVVLWHGMGDSYNSSSMSRVVGSILEVHPEAAVYSISISKDDEQDQKLGLLGNLTLQMDHVCEQLKNESLVEFDAIGFSQGGLFLRGLLETCGDIRINNLITFGSPHNGVYDLPLCEAGDWFCQRRNLLLKRQVYKKGIQDKLIQAQYFRDVFNYEEYLEKSEFIVKVNNDDPGRFNASYKDRMVNNLTGKLVMVMFDKDTTLVPKESAWFFDYDVDESRVLTFSETESYQQDLIGLKELHQRDQIVFRKIDDNHMRISDEFLTQVVREFTGE